MYGAFIFSVLLECCRGISEQSLVAITYVFYCLCYLSNERIERRGVEALGGPLRLGRYVVSGSHLL